MPIAMRSGQQQLERLARRLARRAGLDTVRSGFNSPVVNTDALSPDTWERQAPMPGLELDLDRQLRTIEQTLVPLIGELRSRDGFVLSNPMYGPMDAHVLYAMVRDRRPSRVLELGSGYSTLVIAQALAANGDGAQHEVVDPWPSELVSRARGRLTVRAQSAAAAPWELFASLGENDVLFVDTSHSLRPGGRWCAWCSRCCPRSSPG